MGKRTTRLRDLVLWVKHSLRQSNGNCVEVAKLSDGNIIVRDTANIEGAVLRFTSKEWSEFLAKAKSVDIYSIAPDEENNLYAFLRWVLSKPIRTLGCALLLAVAVAAAVLAPHLLALFV